jgi:drug/metabolite transporter (DMT)-like permease
MITVKPLWPAYLALAVVSVVWGTTYFALRIGVDGFPAFLFSAIRQILAGGILLAFMAWKEGINWKRNAWKDQIVLGVLLITFGNGLIGWSEQFIPSGLAALLVSILPVYIVIIQFLVGKRGQLYNKFIATGLVLGSIGILLIFKDHLKDFGQPSYLLGMGMAFVACLAWASGSVYMQHRSSEGSVLTKAALQMLFGGLFLLLLSWGLDDYSQWHQVKGEHLWALLYLTLIGSVLCYPCYLYAIDHLPMSLVSVYAYINPFIALLLGYFCLHEDMGSITFLALACVLGAIYFIHKGNKPPIQEK